MQATRSSASDEFPVRWIVTVYVFLGLTSGTYRFLMGRSDYTPWFLPEWALVLSIALLLEYGRRLFPPKRGIFYRQLIVAPALLQCAVDWAVVARNREFAERQLWQNLLLVFSALITALMIFGVRMVASAQARQVERASFTFVEPEAEETKPERNDNTPKETLPPLLGQGDTYLDRVIKSVIGRSAKSERAASFSLGIMLILVMIGGMASFGLWAFTHADRINSLEAERNKLMVLQSGVRDIQDKLTTGNEDAKVQLNRLITFIDQNYKEDDAYKATISKLSLQSQTNTADIAIRVTIAVLTIFLVQVFFAVYKYNHHLADTLAAKAEALELVGNDADARKRLSREAASIVREGVPGFGPSPRTPIEEATRVAEKFGKRG